MYVMWNLGNRKSFLLARGRRADRVSRSHPAICSSGTSNRRFIWLVTLSFTLFAGAAWEKVRPQGAKLPDPKTGELVDFLFLIRLTRVGMGYLSKRLIPALCRKA